MITDVNKIAIHKSFTRSKFDHRFFLILLNHDFVRWAFNFCVCQSSRNIYSKLESIFRKKVIFRYLVRL